MDCVIFEGIINYPESCKPAKCFLSKRKQQPVRWGALTFFKWFGVRIFFCLLLPERKIIIILFQMRVCGTF